MPIKNNTILVVLILTTCLIGIAAIFWMQEIKYLLPTPKPANTKEIKAGESIDLKNINLQFEPNKPVLIHFFNPYCPCSRFNLKHVKELIKNYEEQFEFVAVIPAYADIASAKNKLQGYDMPVIQDDANNQIAKNFGVYATPQAVVLNYNKEVYYKGNYNKARYCTLKESSYAALAMDALLKNEPPPAFGLLASTAYGCELPTNEN